MQHNNLWCDTYHQEVLPNEQGRCSLCNSVLYELSQMSAEALVRLFEDLAIERTIEDNWSAYDYLGTEEARALEVAHKLAYGSE